MATDFLHGVETLWVQRGGASVKVVKSAVTLYIGTAPIWAADPAALANVGRPTLSLSDRDAVKQIGPAEAGHGYTLPLSVKLHRMQGKSTGPLILINVFDPAVHRATVAPVVATMPTTNKITLPHRGALDLVVTPDGGGDPFVAGTDYLYDPVTSTVTRLAGGAIPAGAALSFSYARPAPELVTVNDILGGTDLSGRRHGLAAAVDCLGLFGFRPKILVAPGFDGLTAVAAELRAQAERLRAITYISAPIGATFDMAISGRGPTGAINFNTSSMRASLSWPHAKVFDPGQGLETLWGQAAIWAGRRAATDIDKGYWWSETNQELAGVLGLETPVWSDFTDPDSEANILNGAGISTIYNAYGTGYRTWGNSTAARPVSTAADEVFLCVRRTLDIIAESVEALLFQFLGRPLNAPLIDYITETVNNLIAKNKRDGALIDGSVWFDPAENPVDQLAAGQLVLCDDLAPPSPLERVTMKTAYNQNLIAAVYGAVAA